MPHGKICYIEIPATDVAASATFYADAFGWSLTSFGPTYACTMTGDVDVLGQVTYLDVWNHDRFLTKMQREPYTDDDARALSEFGI